jgi:signal transduction histidine kinase
VAHGTIGVTTGVRAGRAVLAVRNTGPVIPPDQVPWLFQPFQRSGAGRTGTREGQGLGLSIVAAIAEAHGAWLRASALTGGGLRVQAGFPPRVSPPPAGVTQAPAVLPPRAAHR